MDWGDQRRPPRGFVAGPARARVIENGPVRIAVQVDREAEGSRFQQTVRLSAGDAGNRIEIADSIDWRSGAAALKATFPLAAANPLATYSWDVATVQRGNNDARKFEVPSHEWFDLTDRAGQFGVTVLSDCKYGSDKPNDSTLRLTLLYTPGIGGGNAHEYADQATQDWGHHEILYGLAGHAGSWEDSGTDWQALRLSQPLVAFRSPRHPGALGRSFSLLRPSSSRVRVLALKKAEDSDEVVIRLVELDGRRALPFRLDFSVPVVAAREIDAQERTVGPATVLRGGLVTRFGPHQIRSFALKLADAQTPAASRSQAVPIPFDRAVASFDGERSDPGFTDSGEALPAELLPREISYGGIRFSLGPAGHGQVNALAARGQTIRLPEGRFGRLYVLAASAARDQSVVVRIGQTPVPVVIQDWGGFIGQWDDRLWRIAGSEGPGGRWRDDALQDFAGIAPGFIKRASVAWYSSHRHSAEGGNEPYSYAYLFAYCFDLPSRLDLVHLAGQRPGKDPGGNGVR